jgi:hypothetical protein
MIYSKYIFLGRRAGDGGAGNSELSPLHPVYYEFQTIHFHLYIHIHIVNVKTKGERFPVNSSQPTPITWIALL